jgi:hypothetical protein
VGGQANLMAVELKKIAQNAAFVCLKLAVWFIILAFALWCIASVGAPQYVETAAVSIVSAIIGTIVYEDVVKKIKS